MRSSKSRSRGKNRNNNRSMGNVVNRVFDSSGPEGKVRGTPQQIIDKYQQLHRDAQLSNDRVAAENFAQHAEHYTRLLGQAMREQEAKREAQEAQQAQQRERQQRDRDDQPQNMAQQDNAPSQDADDAHQGGRGRSKRRGEDRKQPVEADAPQPDVIDLAEDTSDSGLVETVENTPKPARKPRSRKPKPQVAAEGDAPAGADEKPAAE